MTHCECSAPTHNLLQKITYSLGLLGSSPRYKDLLLSLHPSQTPFLPLRDHRNTRQLSLAIPAEEGTMVNFNNASSSSSSNVAKLRQSLCATMCVYLLLIVCGAYGLLTSQAEGHGLKEFKSFWESFCLPYSLTNLVIRHSCLKVQAHIDTHTHTGIHMPSHTHTHAHTHTA